LVWGKEDKKRELLQLAQGGLEGDSKEGRGKDLPFTEHPAAECLTSEIKLTACQKKKLEKKVDGSGRRKKKRAVGTNLGRRRPRPRTWKAA